MPIVPLISLLEKRLVRDARARLTDPLVRRPTQPPTVPTPLPQPVAPVGREVQTNTFNPAPGGLVPTAAPQPVAPIRSAGFQQPELFRDRFVSPEEQERQEAIARAQLPPDPLELGLEAVEHFATPFQATTQEARRLSERIPEQFDVGLVGLGKDILQFGRDPNRPGGERAGEGSWSFCDH